MTTCDACKHLTREQLLRGGPCRYCGYFPPPIEDASVLRLERDAAIKRAEEAERAARVGEGRAGDYRVKLELEREASAAHAGDLLSTIRNLGARADKYKDQRDRALALLRETTGHQCTDYCDNIDEDDHISPSDPLYLDCCDDPPCWEHRRRALLAEVQP